MDFDTFYLAERARVLTMIERKVNPSDAEDIAAEVWLRVAQRYSELDQPVHYLNLTVRTRIAEHYRTRRPVVSLDRTGEDHLPSTHRDDTHNRAVDNINLARVKAVITAFPPSQRVAVGARLLGVPGLSASQRVAASRGFAELRREVLVL